MFYIVLDLARTSSYLVSGWEFGSSFHPSSLVCPLTLVLSLKNTNFVQDTLMKFSPIPVYQNHSHLSMLIEMIVFRVKLHTVFLSIPWIHTLFWLCIRSFYPIILPLVALCLFWKRLALPSVVILKSTLVWSWDGLLFRYTFIYVFKLAWKILMACRLIKHDIDCSKVPVF